MTSHFSRTYYDRHSAVLLYYYYYYYYYYSVRGNVILLLILSTCQERRATNTLLVAAAWLLIIHEQLYLIATAQTFNDQLLINCEFSNLFHWWLPLVVVIVQWLKWRMAWGLSPTCSELAPPCCDLNSTWPKAVLLNYNSWIMCCGQKLVIFEAPKYTKPTSSLHPAKQRYPPLSAFRALGFGPCLRELMDTTLTTVEVSINIIRYSYARP